MAKPNPIDSELQVEGLPPLTGKLDYIGRHRTEELAGIDGGSLRWALAEREQQLMGLLKKQRDRS